MSHPGILPIKTDASGVGSASIAPNLQNLFWRISQVSVNAGGAVLTVDIVLNDVPCTSSITGVTPLTASGEPTIDVGGHDVMKVRVTNAPASTNIVVTYYYEEIQGVP